MSLRRHTAPAVRRRLALALSLLGITVLPEMVRAGAAKLALLAQRLELPGVPIEMFSPDLDGDGLRDLAVVVGSTSWGETAITEEQRLDEDTFVDVLTVVPTLFDKRRLLVFRGRAEGGFEAAPLALELPPDVHAIAAGPSGAPIVAWTDDGLARVAVGAPATESGSDTDTGPADLELVAGAGAPSLLTGSESYVPRAGLARDVDGDGEADLLVPVERGLAIYRGTAAGIAAEASFLLEPPTDFEPPAPPADAGQKAKQPPDEEDRQRELRAAARREVAIPEWVDLDGDRLPDALYRAPENRSQYLRARLNLGGARFGAPVDPLAGARLDEGREIGWIGELDGVPGAELVVTQEIHSGKDSMKAELAEAKRPKARVEVHALGAGGIWNPAPSSTFEIEGYVFEGGGDGDEGDGEGMEFELPGGVRDLDGDGRAELIAIRLDFSLFEAMRVLTTHSIKIGLDFGVYRQGDGLSFRAVPGLDLSGELKLRLDDVSLGQISSFAGDFDGDGRGDFVQLGRGRKVTIHRGQDGAQYAPNADLTVALEREPQDVALVKVADFDGDGRSDIVVTQPVGAGEIGARAALELHLSRVAP